MPLLKRLRKKNTPFLTTKMTQVENFFVGVEYVVELEDVQNPNLFYNCTLCNKQCDHNNIISHLISFRHRESFLNLHFPRLMLSVKEIASYNVDMKFKSKVLNKITRTLERHHGRMRPFVFNYETFNYFNEEILKTIKRFPHVNENIFSHEKKLIYKIKNGLFSEQDEDKQIKVRHKRKKPTKFERNDKRREEERKKINIKRNASIRINNLNRNCYPTHLGSGARCRKYPTPSRIDWDAETTYYTD